MGLFSWLFGKPKPTEKEIFWKEVQDILKEEEKNPFEGLELIEKPKMKELKGNLKADFPKPRKKREKNSKI